MIVEPVRGEPTRRDLLAAGARLVLAGALAGCGAPTRGGGAGQESREAAVAELSARPPGGGARPGEERFPEPGTQPLGDDGPGDAFLHVPPGLLPGARVPLVLTLHGAGSGARGGLDFLRTVADERGLVLVAPGSTGATWDAVRGDFGPDVDVVDRALSRAFSLFTVDPDRVAVTGFSDGASYALGLGLANGDLFSRIVAFSPGFVPSAPRSGHPRVFVSHGDADEVLPVGAASRRIVRDLREAGYDVTYHEFAGGHTVPAGVARRAGEWLGWRGRG